MFLLKIASPGKTRRPPVARRLALESLETRNLLSAAGLNSGLEDGGPATDTDKRTEFTANAKPDKPGGGGGGGGGGHDGGTSYTVMSVGSLAGFSYSWASDINDAGQVVGSIGGPGEIANVPYVIDPVVDTDTQELTWFQDDDGDGGNDLMQPLEKVDVLRTEFNSARAINANGQIVGRITRSDFESRAFLVNPLDTDGDGSPDTWYQDANGDDRNDLMIDLGLVQPQAINDSGQIIGSFSAGVFVIDPEDVDGDGVLDWFSPAPDGTNALMIDLKAPNDPTRTWDVHAWDINDVGQIIGEGDGVLGGFVITPETSDPDGDSRWVRDHDGDGFNDLAVGLPDAIGVYSSAAQAISNPGVIVGSARFASKGSDSGETHAATWEVDSIGEPVDLGLLKKSDDWSVAQDLNDGGVVVGYSWGQGPRREYAREQAREPFVTVNGEMTSLESLVTDMGGFDDLDEISAVNNSGYLVGSEADDFFYIYPTGFIAIPSQPTANLDLAVATTVDSESADGSSQATGTRTELSAALLDYEPAGASTESSEEEQAPPPLWAIDLIFNSLGEN